MRKHVSILLTLCLMLTMSPMAAFADAGSDYDSAVKATEQASQVKTQAAEDYEAARKELSDATNKAEQAQKDLNAAEEALENARSDKDAAEKELASSRADKANAEKALEEARAANPDAADAVDKANSAVEASSKNAANAKDAYDAADKAYNSASADAEAKKSAYDKAASEESSAKAEVSRLQGECDKLRKELDPLEENYEEVNGKLEAAESALKKAEADLGSKTAAADTARSEKEAAEAKAVELQAEKDAYAELVKDTEAKKSESDAAAAKAEARRKEVSDAESEINDLEQKLRAAEQSVADNKAALAEAQAALDAANEEWDAAVEKAEDALTEAQEAYDNLGSEFLDSYFEEGSKLADLDASIKDALSDNVTMDDDYYDKVSNALSYDNLMKDMDYIDESNSLRAANGLSAVAVDLKEMAIAAYAGTIYTRTGAHTLFNTLFSGGTASAPAGYSISSENLAAGYKEANTDRSPFRGWYDAEKAEFDQALASGDYPGLESMSAYEIYQNYPSLYMRTGHYLNILMDNAKYTGFAAIDNGRGGYWHAQEFGDGWGVSSDASYIMSTDEFRTALKDFARTYENNLNTAKSDYDKAAAEPADVTSNKAKVESVQSAIDEATAEVNSIQATIADKQKALQALTAESEELDKTASDAESAYKTAQAAADSKKDDTLDSRLADAITNLGAAKTALDVAEQAQKDAESSYNKADSDFNTLRAEEAAADNARNEKTFEVADAMDKLDKAETVLEKKEAASKSANIALNKANKTLETAQSNLDDVKSTLESANADLAKAEKDLETARANAEGIARAEKAAQDAEENVRKAESAVETASKAVTDAQAKVDSETQKKTDADKAVAEAKTAVAEKQEALDSAQKDYEEAVRAEDKAREEYEATRIIDLTETDIKVANKAYTGKAVTPVPVITYGETILEEGTDFTATYSNNKNIGTATATISGLGRYTGTVTVNFKVTPKTAKIAKPKAAKKAITVKWKKQTAQMQISAKKKARITGYQVQYSTSKTFDSGNKTVTVKGYKKASKKIGKLKAKTTYYTRVRTYIKVGGKTYYSGWSAAKAVKTK